MLARTQAPRPVQDARRAVSRRSAKARFFQSDRAFTYKIDPAAGPRTLFVEEGQPDYRGSAKRDAIRTQTARNDGAKAAGPAGALRRAVPVDRALHLALARRHRSPRVDRVLRACARLSRVALLGAAERREISGGHRRPGVEG